MEQRGAPSAKANAERGGIPFAALMGSTNVPTVKIRSKPSAFALFVLFH